MNSEQEKTFRDELQKAADDARKSGRPRIANYYDDAAKGSRGEVLRGINRLDKAEIDSLGPKPGQKIDASNRDGGTISGGTGCFGVVLAIALAGGGGLIGVNRAFAETSTQPPAAPEKVAVAPDTRAKPTILFELPTMKQDRPVRPSGSAYPVASRVR